MFSFPLNESVSLQLLNPSHANELFEVVEANRHYLREWLPWVDGTTSPAHIEQFIKGTLQQYADNEGFNCGISFNHALIGCIGYHKIDWTNKKTSIGYWLAGSYQGQGIMTLACRKLIDYAFQELQLNRVEIKAAVGNIKSRSVAERVGLTQEGILRQVGWTNERYLDYVVYSILASEWNDGR